MDQELTSFRSALASVVRTPKVTLMIALPPILSSLLGEWLMSLPFELPFPLWKIVFTAFFFARMGLAWHRWQLLGEMPGLRKSKAPAAQRRRYQLQAAIISVAASLGSVFGVVIFGTGLDVVSGLFGATDVSFQSAFLMGSAENNGAFLEGFVVWAPRFILAICFAGILLWMGHSMPCLAIGLPKTAARRLDVPSIVVGAVGFGAIWFAGFLLTHTLAGMIGALPDILMDLATLLVNAPIILCTASYVVTAKPETWAKGQMAAGTLTHA
ncbi:hypothetical protein [Primorskyibacter sp. 2E233]|uniref:hypothetical protein n=1 Tax=Primorskyibacter sp. 2E233 TaxID=3413431 RepID=UPI003BF23FA3